MSADVRRDGLHWAQIQERTFGSGIRILVALHQLLGRRVLRIVLWAIVPFYALASPGARRASLEYLTRLRATYGVPAAAPGWRHWLQHLHAFGETILDKVLAIGGQYPWEQLRVEDLEVIQQAAAHGRGAIVVTAHMGCLELCQAVAERMPDLRLTVLVHTRHAERFNALLGELAPDRRIRFLQVTEVTAATAVELGARIEAGEFVAIAGDRVPVNSGRTVTVPFLGHPAPFPVGGYVLAALLKCPLLFMGCVRTAAGHVIHFEHLATQVVLPRSTRDQVLQQLALRFAICVEAQLQRAPYEWFNFFSFWSQGRIAQR